MMLKKLPKIQPLPFPPRRRGWAQTKNYLPHLFAFTILALPMVAHGADGYTLLAPLTKPGETAKPTVANFAEYAQLAFNIIVGLAGLIAVTIIIIAGIEYVSSGISGNEAARSSAHKRIWDAITGLVLALVGYLILQTINPELVTFKLNIPPIESTASTPPPTISPAAQTASDKNIQLKDKINKQLSDVGFNLTNEEGTRIRASLFLAADAIGSDNFNIIDSNAKDYVGAWNFKLAPTSALKSMGLTNRQSFKADNGIYTYYNAGGFGSDEYYTFEPAH